MKARQTLVPDCYPDFHCIGADCEDTCCAGWGVPVDRETYNRYKQHKNPVLAPLFREFVQKNRDPKKQSEAYYGFMELKPDGSCGFLREDKLCAIQKELGFQALCNTAIEGVPRSHDMLALSRRFPEAFALPCPPGWRRPIAGTGTSRRFP